MSSNPAEESVGVVGLGLMGTAITERLLESGFLPLVWNRSEDKAEALIRGGARWSDNPIAECRRVIISLFSEEVVAEVLTGWLSSVRSGMTIIDTTTVSPEHSRDWYRQLQSLGAGFVEAPISGSSEQTRRGEASVLVGGDEADFQRCRDLWPVLGGTVLHVGPCGNAAKMKLVSNLVLGLNRAALAEGLVFAESLGLDLPQTLHVLQNSAAYSRQMDTKGRKMVDGNFAVQARLSQHLKDVRLMLSATAAGETALPLTEVHRRLLESAERDGFGDADNSAVIEAVRRFAETP